MNELTIPMFLIALVGVLLLIMIFSSILIVGGKEILSEYAEIIAQKSSSIVSTNINYRYKYWRIR